ncbi:HEPN domain-containing protein [Calderihabitans maritimus]|uniref:HEPN domain-containing protein n=1 Tax=Calderihabitans maritimus TaxID=1246530 RepID=A0A1Z5HVJ3_9FIRM|nr:HEPN domain-containing protein [Calderihabitans maritimus]GAW93534.1 HEPN domain-containing protein [Calderihabitans maritimus]
MKDEIKKLVSYRMDRAKEALQEADLLLSAGHVLTSINRLYYSCFYAVSAYLLTKGYSSAKHSGVRSLFHQKVVKPGLVRSSAGRIYNRLFDARQKADYADLVTFEPDDVSIWLEEVKSLVSEIDRLIEKETKT